MSVLVYYDDWQFMSSRLPRQERYNLAGILISSADHWVQRWVERRREDPQNKGGPDRGGRIPLCRFPRSIGNTGIHKRRKPLS